MTRAAWASLDLHLELVPGEVVETACLRDTAGGVYPCYYRRVDGRLRVATWAAALAIEAGGLDPDPRFRPCEYLGRRHARQRLAALTMRAPAALKSAAKRILPRRALSELGRERFWYESWETADRRVRKLRPFETVTPDENRDGFEPDFALDSAGELAAGVAAHVKRFVREIEEAYPERQHVMLLGGKDSQLLALAPKLRPERWHVFSGDPNFAGICRWLDMNDVRVGRRYRGSAVNEETPEETRRKIIYSDLYSDPRHMRWLPALRRVAEEFEFRCFFWSGSAGDLLHVGRSFHPRMRDENPRLFFEKHLTRIPNLVGNYHQAVMNYTGCPLLSPYHSAHIWREIYFHHGPHVLAPGQDARERIGELVAGRPVRWLERNPSPQPYRYRTAFPAYETYVRYIQDHAVRS